MRAPYSSRRAPAEKTCRAAVFTFWTMASHRHYEKGPLKRNAAANDSSTAGERRTGSPGGTPQVNQSPPSPMQGSGTGPQAKVQHLSQNGSLSLSMSCSFACEGWGVGAAGYPEGVPARRAEVKTEMPSDLLGQMGIGAVVGAFCPRSPDRNLTLQCHAFVLCQARSGKA